METIQNAKLLRIFIGELDKIGHQPLYEAIVFKAKELGLAGATGFKGILSYGTKSKVNTVKLFDISPDLPVVIEIIDNEDKINAFIPTLNELFDKSGAGGLVTVEHAEIILYRASTKNK
jgi:PII-like signaling protein